LLALNVTTGPFTTEGYWQNGQDLIGFVGCGAIIKTEVYHKVGCFGEWLYVYGHEWEFGIRVIDAGYSIKYFADSNVIHRASTVNRSLKRLITYSTRNEIGIIYKYFGTNRWKYIALMIFNMLKGFYKQGFKNTYYNLVGVVKFLNMRGKITDTPVSETTQKYYAALYSGTRPFFSFLKKEVKQLSSQS
jgi:GT2 family glycosyltransferase